MSITYVFTKSVNDGTGTISKSETITAGGDVRIDEAITGATTNKTVTCVAASALIKGIYLVSDQNCTVKTNSTTGVDTFSLVADVPVIWTENDPAVAIGDILTADITGLYVTVPTAVTATLRGRIARDVTP